MILPFFLFCYFHFATAQTFSSEERRKEVENILNTVINSTLATTQYNRAVVGKFDNI